MTSEEERKKYLEHQYSPSRWVVGTFSKGQDVVSQFTTTGLELKEKLLQQFPCDLDVVYGNGKKTKVDIYYPTGSNTESRDVLIFIHGGYWQEGSKDSCAFLGAQLNDLSSILVMVGYDLAPEVSMDDVVEEIRQAVIFTAKRFPSSRLFLCGHSAGAHLVAMMMTINWDECGVTSHRFSGVCLLSGIYDLEPLVPTYVNDPIKMNREIAARNSPMKIVQIGGLTMQCPALVVVAEHDSPAFHEQSKDFHKLLQEKLKHHRVDHLDIPGVDHFDIMEKCAEKDFILNKVLANFMKNDNKSLL